MISCTPRYSNLKRPLPTHAQLEELPCTPKAELLEQQIGLGEYEQGMHASNVIAKVEPPGEVGTDFSGLEHREGTHARPRRESDLLPGEPNAVSKIRLEVLRSRQAGVQIATDVEMIAAVTSEVQAEIGKEVFLDLVAEGRSNPEDPLGVIEKKTLGLDSLAQHAGLGVCRGSQQK